ncbi:hypothetical protein WJX72_000660 [[Myrmecia] bisecta]|uniref:Uncharacterized protein n=1 Tax=[Myrmecia] bisecta TaxID=41462 RepID=A0AAW1R5I5_9CHLO
MSEAGADTPPPTSAVLFAISKLIATRCGKQNRAFVECKAKDANPEACLQAGDAVTDCVVALLKDVNKKAPEELKTYYSCLDYYSNNFSKCRAEQEAFEKVVFNK